MPARGGGAVPRGLPDFLHTVFWGGGLCIKVDIRRAARLFFGGFLLRPQGGGGPDPYLHLDLGISGRPVGPVFKSWTPGFLDWEAGLLGTEVGTPAVPQGRGHCLIQQLVADFL